LESPEVKEEEGRRRHSGRIEPASSNVLGMAPARGLRYVTVPLSVSTSWMYTNPATFVLSNVSGLEAWLTATIQCKISRKSLTLLILSGSDTDVAPIGNAVEGALGPPPTRYTCKSSTLAVCEVGCKSFRRP